MLSAPSPSSDTNAKATEYYLKAIRYDSVASVLRQCDRTRDGGKKSSHRSALHNHRASAIWNNSDRKKKGKKKLSSEKLADFRNKTQRRRCHKRGQWVAEHNEDGSLKPGAVVIKAGGSSQAQTQNRTQTTHPPRKRNITLNKMVYLGTKENIPTFQNGFVGPLVEDGEPYSGMGTKDFTLLKSLLVPEWNGKFDLFPESIADRPYWQYGTGKHTSPPRRILGSVLFFVQAYNGNTVDIPHIVIPGASQCFIGRNVTRYYDIKHIGANKLIIPDHLGATNDDVLTMIGNDL